MTDKELVSHLRLVASYFAAPDLLDRLKVAFEDQRKQQAALEQAADAIERLMNERTG